MQTAQCSARSLEGDHWKQRQQVNSVGSASTALASSIVEAIKFCWVRLGVQCRWGPAAAEVPTYPMTSTPAILLKSSKTHGGELRRYKHPSYFTNCDMTWSVFLPPAALLSEAGAPSGVPAPILYYLSGLTCTDLNASEKSGAYSFAAAANVALVFPDTSPRGDHVTSHCGPEATAQWDFGLGAGFYVDATCPPWSAHFRMASYIVEEMPGIVKATLPRALAHERRSITGHSMGGCGALALALRFPGAYRSVSAFAPVAHPSACPWGQKAFEGYLGTDAALWAQADPTQLVAKYKGPPLRIRVDVGSADEWAGKKQLLVEDFCAAAGKTAGVEVDLRVREGYVRGKGWRRTAT